MVAQTSKKLKITFIIVEAPTVSGIVPGFCGSAGGMGNVLKRATAGNHKLGDVGSLVWIRAWRVRQ